MEEITLIVIHPVLEDSHLTWKTGKTHSHTNPWGMFLAFFLCQGSRLEPWSVTEACVLSLAQQANKKAAPTWGACSITKLHHFCTTTLCDRALFPTFLLAKNVSQIIQDPAHRIHKQNSAQVRRGSGWSRTEVTVTNFQLHLEMHKLLKM